MKRTSILILAAVMVMSLAGCSESGSSGKAEDIISAAKQTSVKETAGGKAPAGTNTVTDVTKIGKETGTGSGAEILTPAATEAQDLARRDHSEFSFFSHSQEYDYASKVRRIYEGEITDEAVKQEIFGKLSAILKCGELDLVREQRVTGGGTSLLTLKSESGEEYKICKGILTENPEEEGGREVFIFEGPHSRLYFDVEYAERTALEDLIESGVRTEQNLIHTEGSGPEAKPEEEKPVFPLIYLRIRSNFAWGEHVSGVFADAEGKYFSFDLSEIISSVKGPTLADRVYSCIVNGDGGQVFTGAYLDPVILRQGQEFAAKIDKNAKIREEGKMCDYGQNSVFAVIDGKPVMLCSEGDTDLTVEDENAEKAIRCFDDAMMNAITSLDIDD